jgi:hypothetical protein
VTATVVRGSAGIGIAIPPSRRATAALGLRLVCEGARADGFRYERGVLAEPIARPLDLDDDAVVRQAIEQFATTGSPNTSHHSAKPRFEVRIHRAFFIGGVDQLEEQIAAAGH